jgi:hypothetical protein
MRRPGALPGALRRCLFVGWLRRGGAARCGPVLRLRSDAAVLRQRRHAARAPIETTLRAGTRRGAQGARAPARGRGALGGVWPASSSPRPSRCTAMATARSSVSLNPRGADGARVDEIIEGMRADIERHARAGRISFLMLSGGPPTAKPISVKVRADDPPSCAPPPPRCSPSSAHPGTRDVDRRRRRRPPELRWSSTRGRARRRARPGRRSRGWCACTSTARSSPTCATAARRSSCACARAAGALSPPTTLLSPTRSPCRAAAAPRSRAAGRPTRRPGRDPHWNLRRAITVEADLDKAKDRHGGANRQMLRGWEPCARASRADLDFSGELDDINESLDAMGRCSCSARPDLPDPGRAVPQLLAAAADPGHGAAGLHRRGARPAGLGQPAVALHLYGVIALTGIAVNAAIVLIDAANDRRRRHAHPARRDLRRAPARGAI